MCPRTAPARIVATGSQLVMRRVMILCPPQTSAVQAPVVAVFAVVQE